jgi:predicted MFS family arabinose efflux permease
MPLGQGISFDVRRLTMYAVLVRRVLPLSAGMFVLGLDAYVLSGVLRNLSGSLHVTVGAAGQIVTAFTLSYALLSPLLATVSAGWRRRRVLLGALALFTAANIVSALAPSLVVLLIARTIAGAGAGLFAPTAAATAAALVAPELRARALALSLGGLITATVLGVPIGTVIGNHIGWRATMTLVVVLGALAALLIAVTLPDVTTAAPPSLRARLATLIDKRVAPVICLMLLVGISALGFYTYLGTILVTQIGVSKDLLPLYLMCWGAAGVAGNALVAFLIDRGHRPLLLLCVMLAVLALAFAALPLAGPVSVLAVLIGYGVGGGSAQVPLQHRLLGVVGDRAPVAISLLSGALYLGAAIGTAIGAFALRVVSGSTLGLLATTPVLLALSIAIALARHTTRIAASTTDGPERRDCQTPCCGEDGLRTVTG